MAVVRLFVQTEVGLTHAPMASALTLMLMEPIGQFPWVMILFHLDGKKGRSRSQSQNQNQNQSQSQNQNQNQSQNQNQNQVKGRQLMTKEVKMMLGGGLNLKAEMMRKIHSMFRISD